MASRQVLLGSISGQLKNGNWGVEPSEDHRRAVALLCECGVRAFDRDNYAPGHFTASAFVVDSPRHRLLLIRHRKLGLWLQPGGHVEADDADLVQAALRELEEETGLQGAEVLEPWFDLDVHPIPARGDTPGHAHHDVRVLLSARDTRTGLSPEVDDVAWFDLEELASVQGPLRGGFPTDDSVSRVARRLLLGR